MKRVKDTHPKAVTMDDMTACLNVKAMIANAGKWGGKYAYFTDFKNVNLCHIYLCIVGTEKCLELFMPSHPILAKYFIGEGRTIYRILRFAFKFHVKSRGRRDSMQQIQR